MGKQELKPLKELKFDSVGEEYIFLFETLSANLEKDFQPTIEELRELYKSLSEEDSDNYDDELKNELISEININDTKYLKEIVIEQLSKAMK